MYPQIGLVGVPLYDIILEGGDCDDATEASEAQAI
jgi:hypothetical protein